MKSIHAVIIFFIIAKCITASESNMTVFEEVVDAGNSEMAVEVYNQSESIQREGIDYVIQTSAPSFIARFIGRTNSTGRKTLLELCGERSWEVIMHVLEHVEFPPQSLSYAISEPDIFCHKEKVIYLLGKLKRPEDLKDAIQCGISALFCDDQTEQIPKMIEFLEGHTMLGVNLGDAAIQATFKEGAEKHDKMWIDSFKGHPAIDSETYGDALVYAWRRDPVASFFEELLNEANMNDLEAALSSKVEGAQLPDFQGAICHASTRNNFDVNRTTLSILAGWTVKKVFESEAWIAVPIVITCIIVSYVTDEKLFAQRTMAGSRISSSTNTFISMNTWLAEALRELVGEGLYGAVLKIWKMMNKDRHNEYVYPLITTAKHYKGLSEFLKDDDSLTRFLIHGNESGVREAILKFGKIDKLYIRPGSISQALGKTFEGNDHDRFVCLLIAVKQRCEMEGVKGDASMRKFSELYDILNNIFECRNDCRRAIKRFLVLHGDELGARHPVILRAFSEGLGKYLMHICHVHRSDASFLTTLVWQPFPLSVMDFAKGLSRNILECPVFPCAGLDWREFHEALILGSGMSGEVRWEMMKKEVPDKYINGFPSSEAERGAFLAKFDSRRTLNEGWIWVQALNIREQLRGDASAFFPAVLLHIIAEYAVEWIWDQ